MWVMLTSNPHLVARAKTIAFEEHASRYPLISPEDLIILLLEQCRKKNYQDDALYNGLLGVLKIQDPLLDLSYLHRFCQREKAYQTALQDAGVAA
jgi:hypothetical protein